MNVEQRQAAVDDQTKSIDLEYESDCIGFIYMLSTSTIAIYYYSAGKLMFILPSHGG